MPAQQAIKQLLLIKEGATLQITVDELPFSTVTKIRTIAELTTITPHLPRLFPLSSPEGANSLFHSLLTAFSGFPHSF